MPEADQPAATAPVVPSPAQRVNITDVDMPFWSAVLLLLEWGLASICAAAILAAVVGLLLLALWMILPGGFR